MPGGRHPVTVIPGITAALGAAAGARPHAA